MCRKLASMMDTFFPSCTPWCTTVFLVGSTLTLYMSPPVRTGETVSLGLCPTSAAVARMSSPCSVPLGRSRQYLDGEVSRWRHINFADGDGGPREPDGRFRNRLEHRARGEQEDVQSYCILDRY